MHRFKEAESLLPSGVPETRDDWIGYHIRGMILLKTGKLQNALDHFKIGLDTIPFADERKYFRNALAVAILRQGEFPKAAELLSDNDDAVADVLRIHAFGELRQFGAASKAYKRVERNCPIILIPLRDELAARYKLLVRPQKKNWNWIFSEECANVLLEAA